MRHRNRFFRPAAFVAAALACLSAGPGAARADHLWIPAHYHPEAPAAPAAAVGFLDATLQPGSTGETWLRVPEEPAVSAAVYDSAGLFRGSLGLEPIPGEASYPLSVEGLEPGEYVLALKAPGGRRLAAGRFRVAAPAVPGLDRVPILVDEPAGRDWTAFPVTAGVPFPRGVLEDAARTRVVDEAGREIPARVRPTAWWDPEKRSIRWLEVFFQADSARGAGSRYHLEHGTRVRPEAVEPGVLVTETEDHYTVDAGRLVFSVNRRAGTVLENAKLDGREVISRGGLFLQDQRRREFSSALDRQAPEITVEEAGPLRAVIRQQGWYADADGERLCRYDLRLEAFAGKPWVRVLHTWILTHDSREYRFGDISLKLETAEKMLAGAFTVEPGSGREPVSADLPGRDRVSLVQADSDRFEIIEWPAGAAEAMPRHAGKRSGGSVAVSGPGSGLAVHLREAWQQYPVELEAAGWGLAVHFWPAHGFDYRGRERPPALHRWPLSDGPFMDLQPREYVEEVLSRNREAVGGYDRLNALGIARTHEVWICLLEPDAEAAGAASEARSLFEESPVARACPDQVSESGVFRPFQPADPEIFPGAEAAISARWKAVEFLQDYCHNYGWLHYGDHQTYAPVTDHEGVSAFRGTDGGAHRYWRGSFYRAGVEPWLLWIRSGERRYYRAAEAMSRHLLDIDHVHWPGDDVEPARRPGQGWTMGLSHYNSRRTGYTHGEPFGFCQMYYHLAGYRRAREFLDPAAEELHRSLRYERRPVMSRQDMGHARHLLDMYRLTWERRHFDHARAITGRVLDELVEKRTNPSHLNYVYELLHDWRELTADSRVEPALSSLAEMSLGKPLGINGPYPVLFDLGHLYELTGDPEYIARGKGILQTRLYGVSVEAPAPWHGRINRADPISLTRTIRQVPGFLHYARLAEERHGYIRPRAQPIKFLNTVAPAFLLHEGGRDEKVRLYLRFLFSAWARNHGRDRTTGKVRLVGPGDEVVEEKTLDSNDFLFPEGTPFSEREYYLDFRLRAQGPAGVYRLEISFDEDAGPDRAGVSFLWGLGNPGNLQVAYGTRQLRFDGGHLFFRVPLEKRSFDLIFAPASDYLGEPVLVNAEGRVIARGPAPLSSSEPTTWRVELPAGETGELFGLVSSAPLTVELDDALPPFVYSDPTEFFLPGIPGRSQDARP